MIFSKIASTQPSVLSVQDTQVKPSNIDLLIQYYIVNVPKTELEIHPEFINGVRALLGQYEAYYGPHFFDRICSPLDFRSHPQSHMPNPLYPKELYCTPKAAQQAGTRAASHIIQLCVSELEKFIADQDTRIRTLTDRLSSATRASATLTLQLNRATSIISTVEQDRQIKAETLATQAQTIATKTQEAERARLQIASLEENVTRLRAELEAARLQNTNTQASLDKLSALSNGWEGIDQDRVKTIAAEQAKNCLLQLQLDQLTEKLADSKTQFETAQREHAQALSDMIATTSAEIQGLTTQIQRIEATSSTQLEIAQSEHAKALSEMTKRTTSEIQALKARIKDLESKIAKLKQEQKGESKSERFSAALVSEQAARLKEYEACEGRLNATLRRYEERHSTNELRCKALEAEIFQLQLALVSHSYRDQAPSVSAPNKKDAATSMDPPVVEAVVPESPVLDQVVLSTHRSLVPPSAPPSAQFVIERLAPIMDPDVFSAEMQKVPLSDWPIIFRDQKHCVMEVLVSKCLLPNPSKWQKVCAFLTELIDGGRPGSDINFGSIETNLVPQMRAQRRASIFTILGMFDCALVCLRSIEPVPNLAFFPTFDKVGALLTTTVRFVPEERMSAYLDQLLRILDLKLPDSLRKEFCESFCQAQTKLRLVFKQEAGLTKSTGFASQLFTEVSLFEQKLKEVYENTLQKMKVLNVPFLPGESEVLQRECVALFKKAWRKSVDPHVHLQGLLYLISKSYDCGREFEKIFRLQEGSFCTFLFSDTEFRHAMSGLIKGSEHPLSAFVFFTQPITFADEVAVEKSLLREWLLPYLFSRQRCAMTLCVNGSTTWSHLCYSYSVDQFRSFLGDDRLLLEPKSDGIFYQVFFSNPRCDASAMKFFIKEMYLKRIQTGALPTNEEKLAFLSARLPEGKKPGSGSVEDSLRRYCEQLGLE